MMNSGKPVAVKNPYARTSSNAVKRVSLPASSLNSALKKSAPEQQQQQKSIPTAPKAIVEQRKVNIERRAVPVDPLGKKNQPSLRMKLKKEIEDLKRQQQRQKERLEAERHRRKLEKQAERRKQQAERQLLENQKQQTAEHVLPTPAKLTLNDAGKSYSNVTPSPVHTAQPSQGAVRAEQSTTPSNEHGESKSFVSTSSHQELVSKDPPATPFASSNVPQVASSISSSLPITNNATSIAPRARADHVSTSTEPSSSQLAPIASSSHVAALSEKAASIPVPENTIPLPPATQPSAPQRMAPNLNPVSHVAPYNTQLVANPFAPSHPMMVEGTAVNQNPYSFQIQETPTPLLPATQVSSTPQPMAPIVNPAPHVAPYNVANPFAQPHAMITGAVEQNPNNCQYNMNQIPSGFSVVPNNAFNMPWMSTQPWQQTMYSLQQQQQYYYHGGTYFNPISGAPPTGTIPLAMNPWMMTMAAAYMGQSLPQAQSVRRSANRSSANRQHKLQNQQDVRLISTPCRAPSPFASTHDVIPHSIVMVKHSKDHKGFGVTVKKVMESALVGLDEWPFEQMIYREKLEKIMETNNDSAKGDNMGASFTPNEKVEAPTDCCSTPRENGTQVVKNVSEVAEDHLKQENPQEMIDSDNDPNGNRVDNHQALVNLDNSPAVEKKANEIASEPEPKLNETNPSTAAPEASTASSFPPAESELKASAAVSTTPNNQTGKQERQRRRRRRLFFCVMEVLNPAEQNQRTHPSKLPNMQLEVGDIILTIQGEETGRKSFDEAVKLFASADSIGDDGFIQCVLTIARRRKVAQAPISLPKNMPSIAKNASTTPLTEPEYRALAKAMLDVGRNQFRLLGQNVKRALMDELFQGCSLLSSRAPDFLVSSWEFISERIKREMRRKATEHWAIQWQSEIDEIKAATKTPMTDAQRSSRRARPRPARGCRCGNPDHEFVNDPNCPLYSNLRRLKQESPSPSDDLKPTRSKIKGPKDLNAVEKAFKDRFIRMKEEESALEAEATFVDEMESIQLQKCGMAIFAPGNLASMVLSAAVELEPTFCYRKAVQVQAIETKDPEIVEKDSMNDSDDDSDDDDDVPLTALGKRSSTITSLPHSKKKKSELQIPLDYLISLIRYVCSRWGHVYREPSELDYAWRWEVYHGQFTSADASKEWKNPRRAGALSLENISFLIHDALVSELQQAKGTLANLSLPTLNSIAFAILPSATGIVDELYALLRSSILELNEAGIPKLAPHWFANVDVLLLDDMDSYWGVRRDPTGKFGVSEKVRTTLHREWEKTDEGWILVNEDPYDIVYEFAVFDEWRDAFEDKEQTKADSIEGVGRFGI